MKMLNNPKKTKARLKSSVLVAIKRDKSNTENFECDLHLNLWKHENNRYMLDFGLMLYDVSYKNNSEHTFESIRFYLPYACNKDDITDLGKILASNKEMVSTVFNESFSERTGPYKSSMTIYESKSEPKNSFCLYELGLNDITTDEIEGCLGTFLTITIPVPEEIKTSSFNLYIRFRINITSQDGVSFLKHDEHIANNVLQAAFSRMELYDCRFNDIRDTDDKVYQELISKAQYVLLKMRKVHFFFMTDAKDYIANGNMERMDTRMLETEKWKDYLDEDPKHAYVAYHWKKKAEKEGSNLTCFDSFEVFFRDTCNNANSMLIAAYILLALALGTSGSLISTINFANSINWYGIIINAFLYLAFLLTYLYERWK